MIEKINTFYELDMPKTLFEDQHIQTVAELVSAVSISLMPLDTEVIPNPNDP